MHSENRVLHYNSCYFKLLSDSDSIRHWKIISESFSENILCKEKHFPLKVYYSKVCVSRPKMDSQWKGWKYPNSRMLNFPMLSIPTMSENTWIAKRWTYDCSWRTTHHNTRGGELGKGSGKSQSLSTYHKTVIKIIYKKKFVSNCTWPKKIKPSIQADE